MKISGETFTLSVTTPPNTSCKHKRKKRRLRKKWNKMYNEVIYQGTGWISDFRVEEAVMEVGGSVVTALVTLELEDAD